MSTDPPIDPRRFDHLPAIFDTFVELTGQPLLDYLSARLPDRGERALDLGCGTGRHLDLFASVFDEVVGVDSSPPMLDFARARRPRGGVHFECCDLLDAADGRLGDFDLVFSAYTLHHVDDLDDALRRIRALVRPGGRAVIVDNVDERTAAPRSWFLAEARRRLKRDLVRREPVRTAWKRYRIATNRHLLDHFTTDVFLRPDEFAARYGAAFPGAEITDLYRARAVDWRDRAGASR